MDPSSPLHGHPSATAAAGAVGGWNGRRGEPALRGVVERVVEVEDDDAGIGKASFSEGDLKENFTAFMDANVYPNEARFEGEAD